MEKPRIFLDTDVLINWIVKEVDKNTGFKLWICPYEIMKLVEAEKVTACSALTNVFEIRFVLRRKMKFSEAKIKGFINDIYNNLSIEIPDSLDLLSANKLQDEHPLDPFDAIGLSLVHSIDSVSLVSRDSDFLQLAENIDAEAYLPEKFLQLYFPEIFDRVKADLY
ncbi:predicted nucleic acid-binding protein,containing PIN domain [groundwater metagenome]